MVSDLLERLSDELCAAGLHQWRYVKTSMIDPCSRSRECRRCESLPLVRGARKSPVAILRNFILRRQVLHTYLNPKSERFAARSEGASAEAGFRERINRYDDDTLRALLHARKDPSFKYSLRTAPLSEPALRDICAIPEVLGTSKTMSYSKPINDAVLLVHSLGLHYHPGNLIEASEDEQQFVKALLMLIGSVEDIPSGISPSVIEMLRNEPGAWKELSDLSKAQGRGLENVHAAHLIEHRANGVSAFQGGVL